MNALAYIIGNSDYASENGHLVNAVHDADDISDKLMSLGFTVIKKTNCTNEDFDRTLHEFSDNLEKYDVALFYFSGHGLQIEGINYLTMTDTNFFDATSAKHTSFTLDEVIERMQKKNVHIKILILDACRNNPLPDRGPNPGLAPVHAPKGTIIAFSTSPGETAMDYGAGRNSIYTGALLNHIADKNIPIEDFFKRVRTSVYTLSNGRQTSWEHTSLIGNFCFNSGELVHSVGLPYRLECVADMNFVSTGSVIDSIIEQLRSHDWYKQNPAIARIRNVGPSNIDISSQFLLGRNLLQTADGNEFSALSIFDNLENWLKRWLLPDGQCHVLNGILYEMYFDSEGKFRREGMKAGMIDDVLALEINIQYAKSFEFIKNQLEPFEKFLCYIPSTEPKSLPIDIRVEEEEYEFYGHKCNRWVLKAISVNGKNYLKSDFNEDLCTCVGFDKLKELIKMQMAVPSARMTITTNYNERLSKSIVVPIGHIVNVG